MEPIKLKLSNNSVPVVLECQTGLIEAEICEMTAIDRDRYLDGLATRMRVDASGQVAGVKKFEGLQCDLLVRCLKRKDGLVFKMEEIQSWPASAVSELFKVAQEINSLTKQEGSPLKND